MLSMFPWVLACLGAAWAGTKPPPEAPVDPTPLRFDSTPGEVRELAVHVGDLPGPFVRIRVEQHGTDVRLNLVGSGGKHLTADQPMGFHEPELLVVPPDDYRLRIQSFTGGSYTVRTQGVGPEDPTLPGDVAWTHGTDLYQRRRPEDRGAAKDAFLEAAEAYRVAGATPDEARALTAAGHLQADLGDAEFGLELLRRALALRRSAGPSPALAESLHLVGNVLRQRGDREKAEVAFNESLAVARTAGDRRGESRALLNLGFLAQQRGDRQFSKDLYTRALELADDLQDPELSTKLLNNLGGLEFESGNVLAALGRFEALLPIQRTVGDARPLGRSLVNIAAVRKAVGRYQGALDAYHEAFEVLEASGETRLLASTLNNLGMAYLRLGEPGKARDHLLRALPLRRQAEDRRGEAVTLNNLGICAARRSPEEAESYFARALEIRRHLDDTRGEATTLHHRGRSRLAAGRLQEARRDLEKARELDNTLGDLHRAARSTVTWVEVVLAESNPPASTSDLRAAALGIDDAVIALRRSVDREREAEALWVRARLHRRLGEMDAAARDLETAIDVAESLRLEIRSPDLRSTLLAVKRSIYEEAVDLYLAEAPRPPSPQTARQRAFAVAEQARARGLLDKISGAEVPLPALRDPDGYRRLLEETAEIRYRLDRRHRRTGEEDPALAAQLRHRSVELDRRLREALPEAGKAVVDPPRLGLSELQNLLQADAEARGKETQVLLFSLGEERSWAWLVNRKSAETWELPGRDVLDHRIRHTYEELSTFDPRTGRKERLRARELVADLFGSRLSNLRSDRVAVVPEGPLWQLPFVALPLDERGSELWIDRFETVYLPSASFLAAPRSPSADGPAELAILGASEGGVDVGALPFGHREAERLHRLAKGRARLLTGAAAARDAVLGEALSTYRWIHFTGHGEVDDARPELSALVLSPDPADGDDGRLRLHDIYGMRLDAELVVLGGCETGLGKPVRGEGFLGLTRGFFFAGARRVAAGLWRLEDRATAELMERFYRSLLLDGASPSRSLRQAQLSLKAENRYRDPYYWAGIVLQGDWRER